MSRLPNCHEDTVPEAKLVKYLLNHDHPKGGSKAKYFDRFGYRVDNFEQFSKALLVLACSGEVTEIEKTEFGKNYRVEGILQTPDGRNPKIRTIWCFKKGFLNPSFVTAYPN